MTPNKRLLEQILVLRHQAGDESALEALARSYDAPLRYFVRRLLNDDEVASDILQDVWLTVIRKLRTLRNPEAFSAWLYRIARNRVYQELRKRRVTVVFSEDQVVPDCPEDDGGFSPDDALLIHECLDYLKPEHKEVLVLRFMEEMSYESMAHVVECSVGTIRSRLYHAKRALRKEMEARNDDI